MMEQIKAQDFISFLSLKTDKVLEALGGNLTTDDSLRIMLAAFLIFVIVLFLLSTIVLSIRHIITLLRSNNSKKNINKNDKEDDFADIFNVGDEEELEKELQRELELAKTEQQLKEIEQQEKEKKELLEKESLERVKQEERNKKETEKKKEEEKDLKLFNERRRYKETKLELDWKKGRPLNNATNQLENIEALSLSYKQSSVELSKLLGLAIDMLGRGVDELKIAQTLNFKNQGMSDEEEILKAIDALKEFINLSIGEKFAKLKAYNQLPNEDQALFHLANGDSSLALALLENLMDSDIDKANNMRSDEKRQKMYMEISRYACCFGALAEFNDIMLATSSYELAIELQSTNVVAWGRLGDVYKKASSMPKAIWAYQNVLNFADSEIDIGQIANANKNISEHLYAEGNSLQAAKLYNSSKQYYDSIGINRRLDKKEIEIINLIESNQSSSLPEMINILLSRERFI